MVARRRTMGRSFGGEEEEEEEELLSFAGGKDGWTGPSCGMRLAACAEMGGSRMWLRATTS